MQLLKIFLLTCSHMSVYSCSYRTVHSLCSQADFHGVLCKMLQVSVSHIMRQMIKYILSVSFIHLQYVWPLCSTSKWLSIYNNPKPDIHHFMVKGKVRCAFKQVRRIKHCYNSWSRNLKKGVFSETPSCFKALTLLAPMSPTAATTTGRELWQVSRTYIKKSTSISRLVFPQIK